MQDDAAVMAAVEDLTDAGKERGIVFNVSDGMPGAMNAIFVGGPARNPITKGRVDAGVLKLEGVSDPQGFEIRKDTGVKADHYYVAGGSLMGDVYGLYWIWDRVRVFGHVPDLDVKREPVLDIRLTGGRNENDLRNALRYTANWVSDSWVLDLLPRDSGPEAAESARKREDLKVIVDKAHSFHMKYLATCDEISLHPAMIEEFGVEFEPDNEALWDALQEKYRRLFRAMPELDGLQIRTGELTRIFGPYKKYDVMHEPREHPWPLDKRYRMFLKKMHEVVVGEFDKIYFHRTWTPEPDEQHSDPEVYKAIFTDEIPTKNLYLSPYMSKADRWYYQPYNPTLNLTPHNMLILLAILDYHAMGSSHVFPSFPGDYHQGGLQWILSDPNTNLKGTHFGMPSGAAPLGWDTWSLTAYVVFRLAWEPDEDLRVIARDFGAIHFGMDAADELAEILILSQRAYIDGIYVKPVAEKITGNTLPHLRVGTFPIKGFPDIDQFRAHVEWLEDQMYKPSVGECDEAIALLESGHEAAIEMEERFGKIQDKTSNEKLAAQVAGELKMTRLLVETNMNYIKTIYAYFQYRGERSPEARERLAVCVSALDDSLGRFKAAPGFTYKPLGIEGLLVPAREALEDLDKAEAKLAAAPTEERTFELISEQQEVHKQVLSKLSTDTKPFFRWRGKVDGKDILCVKGGKLEIQHIAADGISVQEHEFFAPMPQKDGAVVLKEVESKAIGPFILEQPSKANDYTVKVYLFDAPPGCNFWEIELYWLDKTPQEAGLDVVWQTE